MSSEAFPSHPGFLYILKNPSLRAPSGRPLLKIGATRKHPLQRAKELGISTGVPTPYVLAYFRDFADCFGAEAGVHNQLEAHRVNKSREFFDLSLEKAIRVVDNLAAEMASVGIRGGEAVEKDCVARKRWEDVAETPLPWSELFASFNDGVRVGPLTEEEQKQCRQLAARLAAGTG